MEDDIIEMYPSRNGTFRKEIEKEPQVGTPIKKPTYPQDWPNYDKAKTNEDRLFNIILFELLALEIDEDRKNKLGRKGYSNREKISFMATKVFYKNDLRKTTSMLKEYKNNYFIEKVPCFKSIDNFFNEKKLSPILDKLILLSALPLTKLEETGAIDSTGFSTSRFERWSNYKWGKKEGRERMWVKAHACIGCKTNIFLSVEVTEKDVGDASMLKQVVNNNILYFDIKKFVADKAYSSREIMDYINNLGLKPFIPFRRNATGSPKGRMIWRIMYDEFTNNNPSFMENYHKRSNIETGFHMIKANYGDSLMTKKFDANVNEIKIKFLCHNICVLIQELFENNIKIDFDSCVKTLRSV